MSNIESQKIIADSIKSDAELSIDDFSYELPPDLIAAEPAAERSSSRLMLLNRGQKTKEHKVFAELPDFMNAGDLLVLNDTKVIPARIIAKRESGGLVEILLLKPEAQKPGVWQAMANPLRKLKEGDSLRVQTVEKEDFLLNVAGFCESDDNQRRVLIDFGGHAEIHKLLSKIGQAPLPPYILKQRSTSQIKEPKARDLDRYQTVYAASAGAVAAPTAGLHFTEDLLLQLEEKGVQLCKLTLHVGPGTFKPVTSSIAEHSVEAEEFEISAQTARLVNETKERGARVFAVGTTSCRALETAGSSGILEACRGSSSLYIRPGFEFKIVDCLITNFHLSRSSLLLLVSAFAGHQFIMNAYQEAIAERYRFYSYGDAMLII
ncbi:MAG: tRNA preQ1(34) S-adenosylmethionine ribosyltransferase-isomerase QueA [Candidatus Obscuribacterales bacterium]|nr:tRNA preQ1(34) S-adenosylmethionine ribosyltransferase-isomerase QueA [Candidatus Obscuribacterales bacterium]